MVQTAIKALSAFGAVNRATAATLLKSWTHRDQLSSADVRAVLEAFPV